MKKRTVETSDMYNCQRHGSPSSIQHCVTPCITVSSYRMNNGMENAALSAQAKNTSSFARFPRWHLLNKAGSTWELLMNHFGGKTFKMHLRFSMIQDLQQLEKFMGCVMASYRSMLSATRTYVDAYVVIHCRNFITLHATLPASHVTVNLHMMSTNTLNRPTLKSGCGCGGKLGNFWNNYD